MATPEYQNPIIVRIEDGEAPAATLPFAAAGGVSPISLLEIYTVSGNIYLWAEKDVANMPSILSGTTNTFTYAGRLQGGSKFNFYGSTQTDTASIAVENISGNTVERNSALALSENEFIGAFIFFWLWDPGAEVPLFTFMGNVSDVDLDDATMDLSIEGFGNWSAVNAPSYNIDVTCGLSFGSMQCGSTSSTPCDQTLGSCSSIERFQGVVIQWDSSNLTPSSVQVAQPPPAAAYNPARPF